MKKVIRLALAMALCLFTCLALTACDPPYSTGGSSSIDYNALESGTSITSYDSYMQVETEKVSECQQSLTSKVEELGGNITSTSLSYDEEEGTGYSSVVCIIPNDNFYDLVNYTRTLGTVVDEDTEISYVGADDDEDTTDTYSYRNRDKSKYSEFSARFIDNKPNIFQLHDLPYIFGSACTSLIYMICVLLPFAAFVLLLVLIVKAVTKNKPKKESSTQAPPPSPYDRVEPSQLTPEENIVLMADVSQEHTLEE